jgi:hypothetical protein
MKSKTYTVKGNRTAADAVAKREETIETGYTLEEARITVIEVQKTGHFVAAWIEEEAKASPLDTLRFALIVAAAKSKTNDVKWLRAIDRASTGILSGELIVTTLAQGALVTSPNGSYLANGSCGCKAFQNGHKECKHRAAARLVELYETAPEPKNIPRNIPRITRSIERDHTGARVKVVRCNGWMI